MGGKPQSSIPKAGDKNIWRLLDANFNRAREGLRILEDTSRFVLNHAAAAKTLRALRHELDTLARTHYWILLSHRDVRHDSGQSNPAKPYKGGIADLIAANCKRCQEALRVIEEYGRLLSRKAVPAAQALRFKVYALEKTLIHDTH